MTLGHIIFSRHIYTTYRILHQRYLSILVLLNACFLCTAISFSCSKAWLRSNQSDLYLLHLVKYALEVGNLGSKVRTWARHLYH